MCTSKWANPFTIKSCGSAQNAVEKYRKYILQQHHLLMDIPELEGKVLGCWCKEKPTDVCHGDVLVELVEKWKNGSLNVPVKNKTTQIKL